MITLTVTFPDGITWDDLATARRLARGTRQRVWLAGMLSPQGQHPFDDEPGKYAGYTYRGINNFSARLIAAGYVIEEPELGPRRLVLTGYVPAFAPLAQAAALNRHSLFRATFAAATPELREWAQVADPDAVAVAVAYAGVFPGEAWGLIVIAEAVAGDPTA